MNPETKEKIISDLYKAHALVGMISLYAPPFKFAQTYDILKDIIQGMIDWLEFNRDLVYKDHPECLELSAND